MLTSLLFLLFPLLLVVSCLLLASLLWLVSLLEFLLLSAFCCCWGPAVVDDSSFPGVSTVVHSVVGLPAMARAPAVFSIHAVVCISSIAGVLLMLTSPLILLFPPLLLSLLFLVFCCS
jgi:hypothetical protein